MRGGDNSKHNSILNVVTINLNVLHPLVKSAIANDATGLSQCIGKRKGDEMLRSSRNDHFHTISHVVSATARYSNCALEHDITFYFWDYHMTRLPLMYV